MPKFIERIKSSMTTIQASATQARILGTSAKVLRHSDEALAICRIHVYVFEQRAECDVIL